MKSTSQIINETLSAPKHQEAAAIVGAVNQLLGEDISSGDTVIPIDDPSYPYQGATGKCKGPSAKGSGFVDVTFEDGTTVPMQSSLLLKRSTK
jgi:hypothetical protein